MDPLQANTIIVDDEENAALLLKKLLEPFPIFGSVSTFSNASVAFTEIIHKQPDFLFLDILMPELSGLQLAERIKSHLPDVKIIYVTAYEHYAIDALRLNVFDYLLKPVCKSELLRIADRLILSKEYDQKTKSNSHLIVRSTEGIHQIKVGEIVYLEADCSYTTLVMCDQSKIISSYNLGKLLPFLPKSKFIRISRKHFVNRKYISFFHSKDKFLKIKIPGMEYKLDVTLKVKEFQQLLAV